MVALVALVTHSGRDCHLVQPNGVLGGRSPPWVDAYCCGQLYFLHVWEGQHLLNPLCPMMAREVVIA